MFIYSPNSTVEVAHVTNYGDGIRIENYAENFVIRDVRITDSHDDCVEDDRQHNGLIDDSYLDGCFVLISSRPGAAVPPSVDGRANNITIQNSLLWQKGMPTCGFAGQFPPCTGPTWKWDNRSGKPGPKLVLKNDVIRIDQKPSNGDLKFPPQVSCENTTLVWLGPGTYPVAMPPGCTVTTNISVWNAAVSAWLARHS